MPQGGLVGAIMQNINAAKSSKSTAPGHESGGGQQGNSRGDITELQSLVSPTLARAAARLENPGVPPLRVEPIGAMISQNMLMEHDTFSAWVKEQAMTAHFHREAMTLARALERGVADFGTVFLVSSAAEVMVRRILALSVAQASGNDWAVATLLEELPAQGPMSVMPDSLLKTLKERRNLEQALANRKTK